MDKPENLHWMIEVSDDIDNVFCTRTRTLRYMTVNSPGRVKTYLNKVVKEMLEAAHDRLPGDKKVYVEFQHQLDDPWNPAIMILAYESDRNGIFLCGAVAYVVQGIDIN